VLPDIIFQFINPLPPSDAVRKQKNLLLEDLFNTLMLQFKKYHSSENLKFANFDIFQSLKFGILLEKILPTYLKLNFTQITPGFKGLMRITDVLPLCICNLS